MIITGFVKSGRVVARDRSSERTTFYLLLAFLLYCFFPCFQLAFFLLDVLRIAKDRHSSPGILELGVAPVLSVSVFTTLSSCFCFHFFALIENKLLVASSCKINFAIHFLLRSFFLLPWNVRKNNTAGASFFLSRFLFYSCQRSRAKDRTPSSVSFITWLRMHAGVSELSFC